METNNQALRMIKAIDQMLSQITQQEKELLAQRETYLNTLKGA